MLRDRARENMEIITNTPWHHMQNGQGKPERNLSCEHRAVSLVLLLLFPFSLSLFTCQYIYHTMASLGKCACAPSSILSPVRRSQIKKTIYRRRLVARSLMQSIRLSIYTIGVSLWVCLFFSFSSSVFECSYCYLFSRLGLHRLTREKDAKMAITHAYCMYADMHTRHGLDESQAWMSAACRLLPSVLIGTGWIDRWMG